MLFISVVSGKGGVGKSTIAALIAAKLSKKAPTLLLDLDVCGPSIGSIFPTTGKIIKTQNGLKPLRVDNSFLYTLSMSSLIKKDSSVIWRAPRKLQLYEMFYNSAYEKMTTDTNNVCFRPGDASKNHGYIDSGVGQNSDVSNENEQFYYEYVVIDTPPGITMVHSFLKEKKTKVLLVTTSQNVAISDSINTITFFSGVDGVVENMSGLKCPSCERITNIYSRNGGQHLAKEFNIPFYGTLEIDKDMSKYIENGTLYENIESLACSDVMNTIIEKVINL